MSFVRKSRWRSYNQKRAKKRSNQRAAKERKRRATAAAEPDYPAFDLAPSPRAKPSGFRVTITCLDDGESVSFTSANTPLGLSISPTLAGRKVAAVLANYYPA